MVNPHKDFTSFGVAKAAQQMLTRKHRLEQFDVGAPGRIEAGVAASSVQLRFGQMRHLPIGRCRVGHDRQRVQVTRIIRKAS